MGKISELYLEKISKLHLLKFQNYIQKKVCTSSTKICRKSEKVDLWLPMKSFNIIYCLVYFNSSKKNISQQNWFFLLNLGPTVPKLSMQPTNSLEMPVPSQGHYGFHSLPVVDWFCLFIYVWVLTFPLEDCSEFSNFVIALI